METFTDPQGLKIADKDARWEDTYLRVAYDLGKFTRDDIAYYLVDEKGVNIHTYKEECRKRGTLFDVAGLSSVDLIQKKYMYLYKLGGRDLFFEALRKGIYHLSEMKSYMEHRMGIHNDLGLQPMARLHVILKGEWYDMIEAGIKKEEYRSLSKDFWSTRLCSPNGTFRNYKTIRFQRGYSGKSMDFKFEGVEVGYGNPDWGAPEGEKVYIIKIGDRVQ